MGLVRLRLMTAMHEVIGHGSGKLSPKLTGDPGSYLKEYYSTLEEARADLVALWNVFDPKLKELGLVSSDETGRAMYDAAVARDANATGALIPKGDETGRRSSTRPPVDCTLHHG